MELNVLFRKVRVVNPATDHEIDHDGLGVEERRDEPAVMEKLKESTANTNKHNRM